MGPQGWLALYYLSADLVLWACEPQTAASSIPSHRARALIYYVHLLPLPASLRPSLTPTRQGPEQERHHVGPPGGLGSPEAEIIVSGFSYNH